jgi:prepilin peptidase CpaA
MHSFGLLPTCLVLCVATFTDLRYRRIPNWLVLPYLAAGVIYAAWMRGRSGLGLSLDGLLLGALVYGLFYTMGGMGAGDVKLCAAIGAWIGPGQLFVAMIVTGIVGGVMVVCWALFGGFLEELSARTGNLILGSKEPRAVSDSELVLSNPEQRKMPYAPAMAIGTLFSFLAY